MATKASTKVVDTWYRTDTWNACAADSSGLSKGKITLSDSLTKPDSGSRTRKHYLNLVRNHSYRGTSMQGVRQDFEWEPASIHVNYVDTQCANRKSANLQLSGYVCTISDANKPNSPSSLDLTVADNRARTKYLQAVDSARGSLRSLVSAGEMGETIRMVQDRGKKLARQTEDAVDRYYYRMMRDRFLRRLPLGKRIAKAIDTSSSMWLETVFGWRPTVSDLDAGAEVLARLANERSTRYVIVKGFGVDESSSKTAFISAGLGHASIKYRVFKNTYVSVRYIGEVQVQPAREAPMAALGLHLNDVLPSIYELIPGSFLLDYFVNLGDVIEGWGTQTDNLVWTERNQFQQNRSFVGEVMWAGNAASTVNWRTLSPGSAVWSIVNFNRARTTNNVGVSLTWRIPGIGSTKWANMAALAAKLQRTRSGLRRLLT